MSRLRDVRIRISVAFQAFLEACTKCGETISADLIRPKETGLPYCPECFTCEECGQRIDGKYYDLDGKTVCENDYRVIKYIFGCILTS